jgi:hypothetical protein
VSKIKISGNASGTGVVTLTAPNTNTDRTITLPDGDITLGGGVDGIVSTANATAITIDSNENVGIGTSSPQHLLETSQSATSKVIGLTLQNSSNTGNTDTGIGVKFKGSAYGGNESNKWSAVYGINDATDGYHNKMALGFFTNDDNTQAPTEKLRITSDGRGLSQFTAKAWVNFNGTGTVAIRDSHNVSSISDISTGDYRVQFTNNMGQGNYVTVSAAGYFTGSGSQQNGVNEAAMGSWNITTGAAVDSSIQQLLVFGD